ncbi:hypothetical protein ACLKMY_36855 [Paraburkholderia mimosarum]|uniref:hypothetical protein n=1 Tax=Paraburkholderia mimosarum TaxID=312026 RepID=UPI00040BE2CF|nr:hypothetical protein [Paraburkholderia mimosarum]
MWRAVDAAEEFGGVRYRVGGDTMHVEMKIKKQLESLKLLARIGVSKSCRARGATNGSIRALAFHCVSS